MNEREPDDISAEARHARELLARMEAPRADREFRARLKQAFVAGSIIETARAPEASRVAERPRVAEPSRAPEPSPGGIGPIPENEPDLLHRRHRPAPRPARPVPPSRRVLRLPKPTRPRFVSILAAAAAIAVVVGILGNRGADWKVIQVTGTGLVQADGEAIPAERPELLAERVHPGVELVLPATASMEISAGSDLAMEILPGTRLTIPPSPPRWFLRRSELYARGGEIRLTTGPTFHGAHLEVRTPEAMVKVNGTTLAVIMEPTGTCVCVLEGEVMMGARGDASGPDGGGVGAMMPIDAGHRGYVFRDGRAPERADIRPEELTSLARFRALRYALLEEETRK